MIVPFFHLEKFTRTIHRIWCREIEHQQYNSLTELRRERDQKSGKLRWLEFTEKSTRAAGAKKKRVPSKLHGNPLRIGEF